MPTASPYRVRERRVAVMLNEVQAIAVDGTPPFERKRSLLAALAPALTVLCGVVVFFFLSGRERVLPHAAVKHFIEPQPVAAALTPVPAPVPHVETSALRLQKSRKFTDMSGVSFRLVRTNVKKRFCDLDVRTGRNGYRRIRMHAGQQTDLPGSAGRLKLSLNAVSAASATGTLERRS